MTRSRRQLTALVALVSISTVAACTEDSSSGITKSAPSLDLVATNARCQVGRNILPVASVDAVRAQQALTNGSIAEGLETISVVVNTTDPNNSSGVFNTGSVEITQVDDAEGRGRALFIGNNEDASDPIPIEGGSAATRIYCLAPGIVQLEATVKSYKPGGDGDAVDVSTRQPFPVRCVSATEFARDCGLVIFDAGVDGGDAGVDAGDAGGDAGDAGSDAIVPVAWTFSYTEPDPQFLEISVAGSGAIRPGSIPLVFTVEELGDPIEGVAVDFELIDTSLAGARLQPTSTVTTAEGKAIVRLFSGNSPGVVSVKAKATYAGEVLNARSPTINIRGSRPSARGMTLVCDEVVAAYPFRNPQDASDWNLGIGDLGRCVVQLSDFLGGRVDLNTQVFFATEAGNIDQAGFTDLEGVVVATMGQGQPEPFDVDPETLTIRGEEVELDYSPRDGLVGIFAVTRGEESFIDLNGNGFYDEGDRFDPDIHDLGEPYIDFNDNGEYDRGETFRDLNRDGEYTEGDGVWSADTDIWVTARSLWVGLLDTEKSYVTLECEGAGCQNPPDGCSALIDPGLGANLRLNGLFVDSNYNCPGAYNEGGISITLDGDMAVAQGIIEASWQGVFGDLCLDDQRDPRPLPTEWLVADLNDPYMDGAARIPTAKITVGARYRNHTGGESTYFVEHNICYAAPPGQ